jgi:hypothetical protein
MALVIDNPVVCPERMQVWINGEVHHSWAISTGMPDYPTFVGFHAPSHLASDHPLGSGTTRPCPT